MTYSCVFQVSASELGSGGDSPAGEGVKISRSTKLNPTAALKGFSDIQNLLEKRASF